jgi:hypothetical protein
MTRFFGKILGAVAKIATALARFRPVIGRIFLSKRENARRASGRFEALKREEIEAERIDRLRNPSKYQGW